MRRRRTYAPRVIRRTITLGEGAAAIATGLLTLGAEPNARFAVVLRIDHRPARECGACWFGWRRTLEVDNTDALWPALLSLVAGLDSEVDEVASIVVEIIDASTPPTIATPMERLVDLVGVDVRSTWPWTYCAACVATDFCVQCEALRPLDGEAVRGGVGTRFVTRRGVAEVRRYQRLLTENTETRTQEAA